MWMVVRVGGRVVVDGVRHVEAVGTDAVVDRFEDHVTRVGCGLEAGTTGSGTSISTASR